MKLKFNDIQLEIIKGNIVNQTDIKAVVNAANAQLRIGGGVAGAIHRTAGPGLEEECRPLAPIKPGDAVITGGHDLPNDHVIHCLGPVYGKDNPGDKLLADCYRNALQLADREKIDSIAFPAISTGAFGFPFEEACEISLKVIRETAPNLKNVKKIRLVFFSDKERQTCEDMVNKIMS